MSTVTATAPGTFDQETHHKKNTWAKVLPIIGIVLIVIYCLAPFYWMLVSSLPVSYTHLTLPTICSV